MQHIFQNVKAEKMAFCIFFYPIVDSAECSHSDYIQVFKWVKNKSIMLLYVPWKQFLEDFFVSNP